METGGGGGRTLRYELQQESKNVTFGKAITHSVSAQSNISSFGGRSCTSVDIACGVTKEPKWLHQFTESIEKYKWD